MTRARKYQTWKSNLPKVLLSLVVLEPLGRYPQAKTLQRFAKNPS